MSSAYKCDRCGCFFAGNKHASISIIQHDILGDTSFEIEVCEKCYDKFMYMLEDGDD